MGARAPYGTCTHTQMKLWREWWVGFARSVWYV